MVEVKTGRALLATMADAVRLAADREGMLDTVLPEEQRTARSAYLSALIAAATLMGEFAKAAKQAEARPRGLKARVGRWLQNIASQLLR